MSPHRTAGEVMSDGPKPLQKGPARYCPACKAVAISELATVMLDGDPVSIEVGRDDKSPLPMPRACTPTQRIKIGWFKHCDCPGEHLHETCNGCGLRWITAFAGET
jgi:hypothetical protein